MQILILFFNLILFLIISFFVFYIPGFLIIQRSKTKLENAEIIALSMSLGIVIFVFLAVLLGVMQIRILMLPILFILSLWAVYKFKFSLFSPWALFLKNKILTLLIFLGILIQGFINFPSGFLYKEGLLFWSSQGHDGIWHVLLMEEIRNNFPPQNPIFAGEPLYNYHYLVDVLMGEFYRIFSNFTSLDLYFRFFPIIFSLLIGISVFAFVSRWKNNIKIGYWAVFFTYFVGSFGYIVKFMRGESIFGGETTFWASQINTILGNPPHAIAISLLTCFFLSFYLYLQERNRYWFIVSFIPASMLAGFKVSAGVVLLVGLGAAALIDLIKTRKFTTVFLCALLGISNFVTIKLMTRGVEGFLMFLPWWFIRTMVVVKLDWLDMELRRQHYFAQGTWHANLRVLQLETEAFLIFLIGNLGMRILGFYEIGREIISLKFNLLKNQFEIFLLVAMLTGFIVPIFFVQRGIIYNNIQFMQYFLLIFGFYAAVTTYKITERLKNNVLKSIFIIILVCLSVPTVIGNLVEFYGRPPLAKITNEELIALDFLKKNSSEKDIILTAPFNKYLNTKYKTQPWPIYAWYGTGYIPALTSRTTFLTSEEQALITNYPMEQRREKMKTFFEQKDLEFNKKFLSDENIKLIYLNKDELDNTFNPDGLPLDIFFENDKVVIYSIGVK